MSDSSVPRTASFDSLRGLATLLIATQLCAEVLVFGTADTNVASWPRIAVYDFSLTNAGIPIFFLISGYFIPASFRGSRPVRNFAFGRLQRLYPVFLVAGLLALALLPFEDGVAVGASSILRSFILMDPLAPATPFSRLHWVLMILLLFYAVCIVAALVGCLHSRLYPTAAIAVLLTVLSVMLIVGSLYHRHFPIAALLSLVLAHLGTLTANFRREPDPTQQRRQLVLFMLFAAAILLVSRFAWSTSLGGGGLWIGRALGYALAMGLFLACAFSRLPVSRALAVLSTTSYPLFFFLPLALAFATSHLTAPPYQLRLLPLGLAIAVAFILAALAHCLIEVPLARRRARILAAL